MNGQANQSEKLKYPQWWRAAELLLVLKCVDVLILSDKNMLMEKCLPDYGGGRDAIRPTSLDLMRLLYILYTNVADF